MNLRGKIVNFLGDSITEGVGVETCVDKRYDNIIKEKCGLKKSYNYGISGTRIAYQMKPSEEPSWDLYFCGRVCLMNKEADVIVVYGGVNDYTHGDAPFGTVDSEDEYTFCGAVNSLINKLKNDFPNSEIIFLTPLHRLEENNPSEPDSKVLADYAEAIVEICGRRGVSVIDLFKINPLDPADSELVPDGLHPSDKGHSIMADVVAEEMLKM